MKITIALSICSVLIFAAGCGKQETTTTPPPPSATTSEAPQAEVKKEAAGLSSQAATTAEAAKAAATSLAAEAASKADDLIKKAKSLVDSQQYKDASNILQQLSNLKLTPEQQKLVDDLKTVIQKALAKEAAAQGAKAVGDLLGGKK